MSNIPFTPDLSFLFEPPRSTPSKSILDNLTSIQSAFTENSTDQHSTDKPTSKRNIKDNQTPSSTIAPFLTRHVPDTLSPGDGPIAKRTFCYRHRPDIMCRKVPDQVTVQELQAKIQKLPITDQQAISHIWSLFSASPPSHRQLILQGILAQCCLSQLSYISGNLSSLIRIDPVANFPNEISYKIFGYLDSKSLCRAAQVSKSWNKLADNDVVWHRMCQQHIDKKCTQCGWALPLLEKTQKLRKRIRPDTLEKVDDSPSLKKLCQQSLLENSQSSSTLCNNSSGEGLEISSTQTTRPWKDIYSERLVIERNWRKGRYRVRTLRGHLDGVMCLQFDDSILISGSYDKTIRVWDMETGETLRILRGHTRDVRALQFDDCKLITGSMDRTLKIWNYRTGECIKTLEGHSEGIVCLNFDKHILASGSVDSTIKVWDFKLQTCFTLIGHRDWVNRVSVFQGTHLFSASDDKTVRLWDLHNRSCVREFIGHVGQVQCLKAFVPHRLSGTSTPSSTDIMSTSSSMTFIDDQDSNGHHPLHIDHVAGSPNNDDNVIDTEEVVTTSNQTFTDSEDTSLDEGLSIPVSPIPHLITGSLDNTLKIWDLSTGKLIKTLFGHLEGVWSIACDSLRLVSGAHDRTVKVWDKDTGKCLHTLVGHQGPVTCVGVGDEGIICSGSDDSTIRIWDFRKP